MCSKHSQSLSSTNYSEEKESFAIDAYKRRIFNAYAEGFTILGFHLSFCNIPWEILYSTLKTLKIHNSLPHLYEVQIKSRMIVMWCINIYKVYIFLCLNSFYITHIRLRCISCHKDIFQLLK